jgi:hypothetical protein
VFAASLCRFLCARFIELLLSAVGTVGARVVLAVKVTVAVVLELRGWFGCAVGGLLDDSGSRARALSNSRA